MLKLLLSDVQQCCCLLGRQFYCSPVDFLLIQLAFGRLLTDFRQIFLQTFGRIWLTGFISRPIRAMTYFSAAGDYYRRCTLRVGCRNHGTLDAPRRRNYVQAVGDVKGCPGIDNPCHCPRVTYRRNQRARYIPKGKGSASTITASQTQNTAPITRYC